MARIQDNLKRFYIDRNAKTIQRAYQFDVDFLVHTNQMQSYTRYRIDNNPFLKQFLEWGAIPDHMVKNVILPQHNFKKEIQKVGIFPRTFPVFDDDGLELRIELEEDENHTVGYFIQFLRELIMDQNGIYTNPEKAKVLQIDVNIHKNSGNAVNPALSNMVATYTFENCYFLNATEPNYSYSANEAVSQVITFGCDNYSLVPHDSN